MLLRNIYEQQQLEIGIQKLRFIEFNRGREHHDLFLEGGYRGLQSHMALVWKIHARPEPKDRTDMLIDEILEAWTEYKQLIITTQEDEAIRSKMKAAGIQPFVRQ